MKRISYPTSDEGRPNRPKFPQVLFVVAIAALASSASCQKEQDSAQPAKETSVKTHAVETKESPTPSLGDSKLIWIKSMPAGIDFTKSEITVAQYRTCVKAGKCTKPKSNSDEKSCNWGSSDRESHPINCVDWWQADDFCSWAGGRLPTEDEWSTEASNKGIRNYPWGDEKTTHNHAVWGGRPLTFPVCSKPKGNSISGLCDMYGNVSEWLSSPLDDKEQPSRSIQISSYNDWASEKSLQNSIKLEYHPEYKDAGFGFRCCR